MTFPPSPDPLEDVERVLVITAHPDDVDFGAAGTIATWTDAGIEVAYCIVTSGEAGAPDHLSRAEVAQLRQAEQRAAAAHVGVTEVTFLGHPDGALYVTHELRRDLTREIRRFRPDRVLTSSPVRGWVRVGAGHPDHLAVGEAAYCAVFPDARNPHAHPELGMEPWAVREVWFFATPNPDVPVDVTGTADRKFAALAAHESQGSSAFEPMMRQFLAANADRASWPGRLAEAFTVVRT